MDAAATTSAPRPTAPDWSTIDREILCPLCDYNLRGLTESRCPECGHRFEWADVTSVDREIRFLFEHARRRLVNSFIATWLGSLACGWFWRRVKTTHKIRLFRLCLYLLILILLSAGTLGAFVLRNAYDGFSQEMTVWQAGANGFARGMTFARNAAGKPTPTKEEAETAYALRTPRPSFIDVARRHASGLPLPLSGRLVPKPRPWLEMFGLTISLLYWPAITFAGFAVFRVSLRRAGVAWAHVFRIVVYCFGPVLLVPALWFGFAQLPAFPWFLGGWRQVLRLDEPTLWVLLLMLTWLSGALLIAMHCYLRIPQGKVMAAITQLLVWLLAAQFFLQRPWRW